MELSNILILYFQNASFFSAIKGIQGGQMDQEVIEYAESTLHSLFLFDRQYKSYYSAVLATATVITKFI